MTPMSPKNDVCTTSLVANKQQARYSPQFCPFLPYHTARGGTSRLHVCMCREMQRRVSEIAHQNGLGLHLDISYVASTSNKTTNIDNIAKSSVYPL